MKITIYGWSIRVVEAIELLVDADQWAAADNLWRSRTSDGGLWRWLPAARLGHQSVFPFVATPARRKACAERLTLRRLWFYLNAAGLYAMNSGDVVTAREYLDITVRDFRAVDDLLNLTEILGVLGTSRQPDALRPRPQMLPPTGRPAFFRWPGRGGWRC